MAFDRFAIVPFKTGLQTNVKPWRTMDDAFVKLRNAYVFRERVVKRIGSKWMGTTQLKSRLRISIGTHDADPKTITMTAWSTTPFAIGQMFSIGSTELTVYQIGNNVALKTTGSITGTINTTVTPNTVTFVGTVTGSPIFWYPSLPVMGLAQLENNVINAYPTFAFDTRYAYTWNGATAWGQSQGAVWNGNESKLFKVTNWRGSNDNSNPGNTTLFVSNFNASLGSGKPTATDDPIWTYNFTWTARRGVNGFYFRPNNQLRYRGPYVQSALLMIPFQDRLLLLNTIENDNATGATNLGLTDGAGNAAGVIPGAPFNIGTFFYIGTQLFTVVFDSGSLLAGAGPGTGTFNRLTGAYTFTGAAPTTQIDYYSGIATGTATQYGNRCRYSWNGTPFARQAWYESGQDSSAFTAFENLAAGAGLIDASTQEQIIGAGFIRNRLIVYFERSNWEIAYTGNEAAPFQWRKLNDSLGAQSTYSVIPFDKELLAIDQIGVHASNGANTERFDIKIPDYVFDEIESTSPAPQRTYGIRDYFNELVYWSHIQTGQPSYQTYPSKMLVYNYRNQTWATFDESATCFGYFNESSNTTWEDWSGLTWEQIQGTWQDQSTQSNQRYVIKGNQQGFVTVMTSEYSRNAGDIFINNLDFDFGFLTVFAVNHNLRVGDYVLLENIQGTTTGDISIANDINGKIFGVTKIDIATNQFTLIGDSLRKSGTLTYKGGGTAAPVSQIEILTKQFNPYVEGDRNLFLSRVDFGVTKTSAGKIFVNYLPSSGYQAMRNLFNQEYFQGTNMLQTSPYDATYAPYEQFQELLWHPLYFQVQGSFIQLQLILSDDIMTNVNAALSPFELQGMILYTRPTAVRLGA